MLTSDIELELAPPNVQLSAAPLAGVGSGESVGKTGCSVGNARAADPPGERIANLPRARRDW